MAGRRLRQAVKNTLVKNGNGQFNSNTRVVIAGLAGDYSQRYEVITCPALGLLDRL
jgi:neutral ceramidase